VIQCADGSIRAHAGPYGDRNQRDVEPARWGRGRAWGMRALMQAAQRLSDDYARAATCATEWWLRHTIATRAAPWDFDDPAGPVDTSATAIAVALLRLDEPTGDSSAPYKAAAFETIATLAGMGSGRAVERTRNRVAECSTART
jgi:hypothetical protein